LTPCPELLAPCIKVKVEVEVEVENHASFLINKNHGGKGLRKFRKFRFWEIGTWNSEPVTRNKESSWIHGLLLPAGAW
jgi:hypothetical protein